MFLDILDQPINKGDLIIHLDRMGTIMGIVEKVTPGAVFYTLLNVPNATYGYFVRVKSRILKVQLNGSNCKAIYEGLAIEDWLEQHRGYGRSC